MDDSPRERRALAAGLGPGLILVLLASSGTILHATRTTGNSADDWPAITPEERNLTRVEQDPEAAAVVLLNERNGRILRKADDFVNVLEYHLRYKILNERGKRYGEVEIEAGKYSRVSDIKARSVKVDGTVVPVAPDQIFEKVTFQVGGYKETAWVFHFPVVEPGTILEYRYTRHDNALIFLPPFYCAGPEFTLRSLITQGVPEDMGYTLLCDLCSSSQPPSMSVWREGKAKGTMYRQELRDVPGYKNELLMPPERDVSPRLEMLLLKWKNHANWGLGRQDRFFVDWPSVALYTSTYYQEALKEGLSDLKPVVEEWVRGIADAQEKVRTIFRHVQRDFAYSSHDEVYGWARTVKTMLKDKVADNEDKAVILMAALKTIGVESYATLVSGKNGGSLNPKFFSLSQFTHAIVAVPGPGDTYQWLDPTVTYAPFGFVAWKDSGAEALLIKGEKGDLITLPTRNELSASRYKVLVKPRKDGRADLDVEAEFTGEDAVDLRQDLVPAAESARKTYLEKWVARRRSGATLRTYAMDNLDDLDQPLRMKLDIEAPGMVTNAEDVMLVKGCVLTCRESNPISSAPRQYPFYVDRGWNVEETVTIQAPDSMKPSQSPPSFSTRSAIGVLASSCMPQGEQGFKCSRTFVARRNRWPASEQTNIRAMFDKIIEADRMTVAFQAAESVAGAR